VVKGSSYDGGLLLDLADIMKTNVPLVARPVKDLGITTGRIMAFQDQHFFAAMPGEQGRPPIPEPTTIASQDWSRGR